MPARCKLVELYVRVHSAKRSKLAELSNEFASNRNLCTNLFGFFNFLEKYVSLEFDDNTCIRQNFLRTAGPKLLHCGTDCD